MLHCPGFEDVVGEKGAKAQREEGFAGDYLLAGSVWLFTKRPGVQADDSGGAVVRPVMHEHETSRNSVNWRGI